MQIHQEPPTATNVAVRRPVITLWLLRVTVLIHAVVVFSQSVTIGQYMTGVFSMIKTHGTLGSLLTVCTMAMGAAALAYVIAGGRVWTIPVLALFFFMEGFQVGMGYAHTLSIHVPLGVLITVLSLLLAIWVWMPSASRGRPKRRTS